MATPAVPTMPFVKLIVEDPEALMPFYRDAFQFKVEYRVTENEGDPEWGLDEILMHAADDSGTTLVLLSFHERPPAPAGGVILGLSVPDLPAAIDAAVAHGGSVLRPLEEMPQHGVKVAFLADPAGTMLEVIEKL